MRQPAIASDAPTKIPTNSIPVAPGESWHTEIVGLPLKGLRISFE